MKKKIMSMMLAASALTACQQQHEPACGIDFSNLDTTAHPGDNFFRYATGNWITNNPQPAEYPRWGSFTKLGDDNIKQVNELIQGLAAQKNEAGSVAQKVGDLFTLANDSVRRNTEAAAPMKPYLEKIQSLKTREELLAYMAQEHDALLFDFDIDADLKNSKVNVLNISQGGLSLGIRDYYVNKDEKTLEILAAFRQHIVNLYKMAGFDEATAKSKMETVLKYETQIAEVSKSRLELRDPEANYHKMDLKQLSKATNGFDWKTFLCNYGYDATEEVILGQELPVALACKMLLTAPVEDLKTIYEWQAIRWASNYLSDDFTEENFSFSMVFSGAKEMQPRWKRSVNLVNGQLGQAVGRMYVEKYFPAESKERMLQLVGNLKTALGKRIEAQEWMSDSTKQVALEKLSTFYVKIGYPDKWDDLSPLNIDPSKPLIDNIYAIGNYRWELNKQKRYNKPVDKDEWLMNPQTVNAYYNPLTNEICFPAGILQPPFFDIQADDATNYGAIGVVIGHEMTHGFDDQGRQFDKDGNLRVWWNDEDVEKFKVPAEQLATFFDSLYVLPGLHANGHLCLGENLADHGGLNVAMEAFRIASAQQTLPTVGGFTPEQRFFLSYANVWAGVNSEEGIRYLTTVDVHSINYLRVNGTLPHIDSWYEAFDVKPGDSLYVAPEERVKIW